MRNRNTIVLILIILLALVVLWIGLPIQHIGAKQILFWQQPVEARSLTIKQGLDLQGGTQILLEAKPDAERSRHAPPAGLHEQRGDDGGLVRRAAAGHAFVGQTEFLSQLAGAERTAMMLLGEDDRGRWLRVALVTTHVSIRLLPQRITQSKAELAVELAAKVIGEQVDPARQRAIADQLLRELQP